MPGIAQEDADMPQDRNSQVQPPHHGCPAVEGRERRHFTEDNLNIQQQGWLKERNGPRPHGHQKKGFNVREVFAKDT